MGDFFQPNGLMSENKFWNGVKGVQTQGSTSIAFLLPPRNWDKCFKSSANSWAQVESDSGTVSPAARVHARKARTHVCTGICPVCSHHLQGPSPDINQIRWRGPGAMRKQDLTETGVEKVATTHFKE